MITDHDRSGYFGGSDMDKVLAKNRNNKSWKEWWLVKLGEMESTFKGNKYTEMGNMAEHRILNAISDKMVLDRQIIDEDLKLRVNYDGDLDGVIYEVKTHKADKQYEVSTTHWRQAQAEMFQYKNKEKELELPPFRRLYIVSYPLYPDEYYSTPENIKIDANRIKYNYVKYDKNFVKNELKPVLKELARCLKKGKMPI